jgi:dihydropyrimidinase
MNILYDAALDGVLPHNDKAEVLADLQAATPGLTLLHREEDLHHGVDYTPYEGIPVSAWPALTLSRGVAVWRDGDYLGTPGRGEFLRCDLPAPARPKPRHVS